jgi:hypothetical protein
VEIVFNCKYDVDDQEDITDTVKLISEELIGWAGMNSVNAAIEDNEEGGFKVIYGLDK